MRLKKYQSAWQCTSCTSDIVDSKLVNCEFAEVTSYIVRLLRWQVGAKFSQFTAATGYSETQCTSNKISFDDICHVKPEQRVAPQHNTGPCCDPTLQLLAECPSDLCRCPQNILILSFLNSAPIKVFFLKLINFARNFGSTWLKKRSCVFPWKSASFARMRRFVSTLPPPPVHILGK